MREALRIDVPSSHSLQTIVADSSGCLQCPIEVSDFEQVALIRGVCPHPGETICLQLQAHGSGFGRLWIPHLSRLGRAFDPQQLLHVMSDFMGQHVGFCKLARGAKTSFQFVEEIQVDVHLFVLRTIKRTRRRLSHATTGVDGIAKQNEFGMMILHAFTREDFSPRVLSIVENEGHELHQWLLGLILFSICRGSLGPILLTNRDRRFAGTAAKQGKKIAMENQAQDKNDNQSSDTEVEPSNLYPSGAT